MTDPADPDHPSTDLAASWRRLALLLAGLLVVAVVGVVVLWLDRGDGDDDPSAGSSAPASTAADQVDAGRDAEAAAKAAIVRMTSYDYRTVDADFAWVGEIGTDEFESYFAGASADVKDVVTATRATAAGTVVDSAPRVVDPTHVTVLLFVDQDIQAARQQGSKVDQTRVSMDMVLTDGTWLVDKVRLDQLLG